MGQPEEKLLFRPNKTGHVSVCLAYPNDYGVAMGNLGYQTVYRILATTPGVVCERLCMPVAGGQPRTLESGRRAGEFDLIAFSQRELLVLHLSVESLPQFRGLSGYSRRGRPGGQSH